MHGYTSIAVACICVLFLEGVWALGRALQVSDLELILPSEGPEAESTHVLPANAHLTGVWVKDARYSDPMDAACDVMHLHGLVRMAVRLVRGLELRIWEEVGAGHQTFEMAVFSVVPWFKVRERYDLNGNPGYFNRRDLRRGKHKGVATVLPSGNLQLKLEWGEPWGGHGTDTFTLVGTEELQVMSRLHANSGATTSFNTVYRRKR